MQHISTAHHELQALLGTAATDDSFWHDLRRFEQTALPIIDLLWSLDTTEVANPWQILHPSDDVGVERNRQRTETAVTQLFDELGANTSRCAAAFYLGPQLWQPAYGGLRHMYNYSHRGSILSQLLGRVAAACLKRAAPPDWPQRLGRWMRTLCLASGVEHAPDLAACVSYLLAHDVGVVAELLDALSVGEWDGVWRALAMLAGETERTDVPERLSELWHASGARVVVPLLARLHGRGLLDATAFRAALSSVPSGLATINRVLYEYGEDHDDRLPDDVRAVLRGLLDAVLWELLCDLRPETWPTLAQLGTISGGRALLRITEEIARRDLATVHVQHYQIKQLAGLLGRLLSVLQRREDDDHDALVALLRELPPAALLAALPHTLAYTQELCAALGWPNAEAFVSLLRRIEQGQPNHSTDPTAGVVSRREVLALTAAIDKTHVESLLHAFASTCGASVLLVRAVLGVNRTEVRRFFGRRGQLAARAIGLLPLEKPDEVLHRYLALRRYEREANSSAAGRKTFERAAAQAGLANLAENAGYADVTRLEWAMEDQLGAEAVAIGQEWSIEGYTLRLALHDGNPALQVRSPKRLLKRTPTAVRRDYVYREVRVALEGAQDQQRRYRQALLQAMRSGQALSRDELILLRRNPVAVALLERLILIDAAGAVGMFRAEDMSLEGVHGERVLIGASVTVAHALTLADLGLLADWQAAVVAAQVVQPFKQVFREIYRVTPAELQATYSSARLAGRRMKGRQATAVLANLGWSLDGYGGVRKPFYDLGFAAEFEAGSGYVYGEEDDGTTTGALAFWPLVYTSTRGEARIPLATIPTLVFSEVLRDLDITTAIAHQSEEHGTSHEVLRGRSELVQAIVQALGMAERVSVELPHVFVHGTRASYRIHLATGAIYLENGQYLCIVPSKEKGSALYVPYAEGGEPLASEIVSKVLQLANDATITDPTILAQIPVLRQAA